MRTCLFAPLSISKIRVKTRTNKVIYRMPMCVENVPIPVRKKKCVPKRISLSVRIFAIVLCMSFMKLPCSY